MPATTEKPMLTTTERNAKIQMAILNLQAKKFANVAEAARQHGVAESTLRDRLQGRGTLASRPVRGRLLTDNEELGLCLHLDQMDDNGFPLRPEMLEACAN